MNVYQKLAFRAAAATILTFSLAGCVQVSLAERAKGSAWREIGPPAKSTRIYVAPLNPASTGEYEPRPEETPQ